MRAALLFLLAASGAWGAETWDNLSQAGFRLEAAGDFQGAKAHFADALKHAESEHNAEAAAVFRAALGRECMKLGQWKESKGHLKRAVEELGRFDDQKQTVAMTLAMLGFVLGRMEEFEEGIPVLKRAAEAFQALRAPKQAADALQSLAVMERATGRFADALNHADKALTIEVEAGDARRSGFLRVTKADVYFAMGQYQDAVDCYRENIQLSSLREDWPAVRSNMANLSSAYADLGDDDLALDTLQEAQRLPPGGLPLEQDLYMKNLLALQFERQGRISEAEAIFRGNLEAGKGEVYAGVTKGNLGDLELERGNTAAAFKYYTEVNDVTRLGYGYLRTGDLDKAAQCYKAELGRDYYSYVEYPQDDLVGLGYVAMARKEPKEAEGWFQRAIDMAEEEREGCPPGNRVYYFGARVLHYTRAQAYWGEIKALMAQGKPAEAFECSETLKARVLGEAMTSGAPSGGEKVPDALVAEGEQWRARLRELKLKKAAAFRKGAKNAVKALEAEILSARKGQRAYVGRLRRSHPGFAALRYPEAIRPSELRLGAGEALVAFQVTEDRTFAFLWRQGKLKTREIPLGQKALAELVAKWRQPFQGAHQASDLAGFDPEQSRSLCQTLLGDWPKALAAGTRLVVVPDDSLALIPFESLVLDSSGPASLGQSTHGTFPLGLSYLGDRLTVTYAQSATSLVLLRARPGPDSPGSKVIVVCDPVFSPSDIRAQGKAAPGAGGKDGRIASGMQDWRTMGIAGVRDKGQGAQTSLDAYFPRLEKTAQLGDDLGSLFGDQLELYAGLDANKEHLEKASWSRSRYVVFATHGILDGSLPYIRQPALVLSQTGPEPKKDGFLTMGEISAMQLNAETVVLTACETGLGRKLTGEGVMGLGRAFQVAGAKSVLMSLWEVSEDASVALTRAFFKQLKAGQKAPEALNLARQEIRRDGYENPFYWASFVLVSP